VPYKRRTPRTACRGRMTLQDFNALGIGDEAELVDVYGSVEEARKRNRL
jgi:hypothetical protein